MSRIVKNRPPRLPRAELERPTRRTQKPLLPSTCLAFSKGLVKVFLLATVLTLTASCWVSIPSYVHDFGHVCYPDSSLKKNPYGQVIREQFSFLERSDPMLSPEGLRSAAALVELGVPVNAPVENGSTPLMWASWAGFQNLVGLFIDAGADVNAQAMDGVTPLFCSMFDAFGVRGTTERLLAAGANADTSTRNGTTPLMIAARRVNLAVVEVLLEGGADPNRQNDGGMTALMFATMAPASDLQTFTVELLLLNGANASLHNGEGMTALMIARANQNEEITRLLEPSIHTP